MHRPDFAQEVATPDKRRLRRVHLIAATILTVFAVMTVVQVTVAVVG